MNDNDKSQTCKSVYFQYFSLLDANNYFEYQCFFRYWINFLKRQQQEKGLLKLKNTSQHLKMFNNEQHLILVFLANNHNTTSKRNTDKTSYF